MQINHYILTVAQCGTISKAAEKLNISQPALSAHVKKVEEQYGIVIFDRSVKPMTLTEEGELYLSYVREKLNLEKAFQEQLSDINDLKWGSLTLGGASFFNVSYLSKAIAEFTRIYPEINIKVIDGSMPEITDKAVNHEIDLFIAPSWNMDQRCNYEKVVSERIFLCVPEELPVNEELIEYRIPYDVILSGQTDSWIKAKGENAKVDIKAFANERFVTLGGNQHIGHIMEQLFERYGFHPEKSIAVEQTMTSLSLTMSGAGISLITEGSLRNGNLQKYPALYLIDEDLGQRDVYVAYAQNKYLSKAAKAFIEVLKKTLAD